MSRDGSAVPRGQRTLVPMPADVTSDDVFCRVSRIFLGRNGCIAGQQFRSGIRIQDGLIIGRDARDRAMNRLAAGSICGTPASPRGMRMGAH
jgi:hypothetical protein